LIAVRLAQTPRACLVEDGQMGVQVQGITHARNASTIHNVAPILSERQRNLILHDLDSRAITHHCARRFDIAKAANIHADARVKPECIAARGSLGAAEYHSDSHANLIAEDN